MEIGTLALLLFLRQEHFVQRLMSSTFLSEIQQGSLKHVLLLVCNRDIFVCLLVLLGNYSPLMMQKFSHVQTNCSSLMFLVIVDAV
jgi:hypothetical protein